MVIEEKEKGVYMEKKLEKQWKRLDIFANMNRAAHNYLYKIAEENPTEKEHY